MVDNTERLNLMLTNETRTCIEDLQKRMGADSLAEVIRRAIGITDFLLTEYLDTDSKLVIRHHTGQIEREVVLFSDVTLRKEGD